ncbi:hypothetical protein KO317_02285 [Candidatus Micrarchaeota archaeon]|nr:hypothetical protein [Candidatus Micrarchaeota archaeon]
MKIKQKVIHKIDKKIEKNIIKRNFCIGYHADELADKFNNRAKRWYAVKIFIDPLVDKI